ncbi:MAG: phosphotransferase family protein [Dehalococcoidia bacterium]|nr:phosphotransferase family protein [Dehalococcoidia bacterium]
MCREKLRSGATYASAGASYDGDFPWYELHGISSATHAWASQSACLAFRRDAAVCSKDVTSDELTSRLRGFLAAASGHRTVTVEHVRRVPGGASRETWAFDARFAGGLPRPLILRRDPGPMTVGSDRGLEFRVLRAMYAAGIPVPEVLWLGEDPSVLGGRFFVMERIEGETLARRLLRDPCYAEARRTMPAQLGATLARIHAVPVDTSLEDLPGREDREHPAVAELGRYEQLYRALAPEPHPVIEYGFRWLARRVPPSNRRVLVHGDYRIGNVMFGPEGLRVVLDWEQAHIGDPMEDLGWMCVRAWRFGSPLPVGGIGAREDFFRAYTEANGEPVEPEVVRFWEAVGNLKWAVICIVQAQTHLDGRVRSVELASLGRRTAEAEYDFLQLVD